MVKHQYACLNMYKTMIINTITSREDRATITAHHVSHLKSREQNMLLTTVGNGRLESLLRETLR